MDWAHCFGWEVEVRLEWVYIYGFDAEGVGVARGCGGLVIYGVGVEYNGFEGGVNRVGKDHCVLEWLLLFLLLGAVIVVRRGTIEVENICEALRAALLGHSIFARSPQTIRNKSLCRLTRNFEPRVLHQLSQ